MGEFPKTIYETNEKRETKEMIDYTLSDKLKIQYQTAKPFPYIVIDNFLPEFLLESCLEEIKQHDEWYSNQMEWVEEFERNKLAVEQAQ